MREVGNPFQEESQDLRTLDTNKIPLPTAVELVKTQYEKGHQAVFKDFLMRGHSIKESKRTKQTSFNRKQLQLHVT